LVARPSGEHYLNLVERLLALLDEGGVPPGQAAWGVDLLLQVATATAAEHAVQDGAVGAQDDWDALTHALQNASGDTHPRIASLADELLAGTPQARMTWGFQMLINGILHTPRPAQTQGARP
jgi:hypothetical protein